MDINNKINDLLVELINTVMKKEESVIRAQAQANITINEVHTLEAIGVGKTKTMTQVAGVLKVSISALTIAINKLVKKGYVARHRTEQDRRIVKIQLTDAGVVVVEQHRQFHMDMVDGILDKLKNDEARVLLSSLEKVKEFFDMQLIKPVNKTDGALKLQPINIGGFKLPIPIFQGGMGIGVSLHKLAAAVAKCGGLGTISASQVGFNEPDFYANPKEANVRAIKKEVSMALKELEGVENPGLIAINMMSVAENYDEIVEAAIEAGANAIVAGAGLPMSLPSLLKGRDVKLMPIVSSARAAGIIIKNWAKKYNKTPDAIIFEGPLAGGHLGFKEEQLEIAQDNFYKTIGEIKNEMAGIKDCPLIVGGGIFDREDVEKAMAYGADGVQLGTRFVVTEECDAPDEYKEAYINAKIEDIQIVKSPVGMPGRAIRNKFLKTLEETGKSTVPWKCNSCLTVCKKKDSPYCITQALINAAKGQLDNALIFCGSNAYRLDKIVKVRDIFNELAY